MRIEREDDRRSADFPRLGQQPLDEARVPAMDAVEIANRHRAVAEIGRQVVEGAEETHGGMESGVRSQGSGTKHQASSTKSQTNSKHEIQMFQTGYDRFRHWNLSFGACLGFGA